MDQDVGIESIENDIESLNRLAYFCHSESVKAGWYKDLDFLQKNRGMRGILFVALFPKTFERMSTKKRNILEMLMLIVTEAAEAAEGFRKNLWDTHLPHRKMIEVELADLLIRIFDLAGYLGLDLSGAFLEKIIYNLHRLDHKLSSRMEDGGKKS